MYPTPQQIMAREMKFRKETIRTVKNWKAAHFRGWRDKTTDEKMTAIAILVRELGDFAYKDVGPANFRRNSPLGDCYHWPSRTIHLETPSIITALHEFAHHLGMGEHGACRWSVWLFKKVFPGSFAKLRFIPGSHMLVRQ